MRIVSRAPFVEPAPLGVLDRRVAEARDERLELALDLVA
jgi:hypothetical protein